jgi:hypothetical protein
MESGGPDRWFLHERLLIALASCAVIASVLGGVAGGVLTYIAVGRQIEGEQDQARRDRLASAYGAYVGTLRTERERITELHFKSKGPVGRDNEIEQEILAGYESVEETLGIVLLYVEEEGEEAVHRAKIALDELHRAARDARDDYDQRLEQFDAALTDLLRDARRNIE